MDEPAQNNPEVSTPVVDDTQRSKMSKLKIIFLYVLIGGLVVSALISVIALLVGSFNEVVQKALLTTLIFVSHALLALGLVSADRNNSIGKALIPTTILVTVAANMITSTLGTWEVWSGSYSWRALGVYALVIGAAFILKGVFMMNRKHTAIQSLVYATAGLVGLLTAMLATWILLDEGVLGDLFYRGVAAVSILAVTVLIVTIIVSRILISKHPELAHRAAGQPIPGGMLAIYITVGVIVALYWFGGFVALLIAATRATDKPATPSYCSVAGRSYYEDYRCN